MLSKYLILVNFIQRIAVSNSKRVFADIAKFRSLSIRITDAVRKVATRILILSALADINGYMQYRDFCVIGKREGRYTTRTAFTELTTTDLVILPTKTDSMPFIPLKPRPGFFVIQDL